MSGKEKGLNVDLAGPPELEERCGDETERGFIQDPVHAIADY